MIGRFEEGIEGKHGTEDGILEMRKSIGKRREREGKNRRWE